MRVLQAGVLVGTGDEAVEKPEPAGSKRGPGSGSMVVCSGTTGASGATTTGSGRSRTFRWSRCLFHVNSPLSYIYEKGHWS